MKKKALLKILVGILALAILIIGGASIYLTKGLKNVGDLTIGQINKANLKDGLYAGKFDEGRFSNEVVVTVENGRIVKIDVMKTVLFERPEVTGELFARVIEKQDTDVDMVSGATVTCKAYLKAVENALAQK